MHLTRRLGCESAGEDMDLDDRNIIAISLLFPLELEYIVIDTSIPVAGDVVATGIGTRLVHRATAGDRIEERAAVREDRILATFQDPSPLRHPCKTPAGLLDVEIEMVGKPLDIGVEDLHEFVDRTAVGHTVQAIVFRCSHE
jgi:hypothetical protein